jgi:hypothetical protein
MIERIAIEALIGVIAICTVVPLGLRYILRARREVRQIVTEERDQREAIPSAPVATVRREALPEQSQSDEGKPAP